MNILSPSLIKTDTPYHKVVLGPPYVLRHGFSALACDMYSCDNQFCVGDIDWTWHSASHTTDTRSDTHKRTHTPSPLNKFCRTQHVLRPMWIKNCCFNSAFWLLSKFIYIRILNNKVFNSYFLSLYTRQQQFKCDLFNKLKRQFTV